MIATDAASAAATWRPQRFGRKHAGDIRDPLVEPLWAGPRVLAYVHDGEVQLTDDDGEVLDGHDDIRAELAADTDGSPILVEGVLTFEPLLAAEDVAARVRVVVPTPSSTFTQMMVGDRGDKKARMMDDAEDAKRRAMVDATDEVALVAVDLVWLDDQSICDVPLLERRRLLESVVRESNLVRIGVFVKPPIDSWLGAWRAFGFHRLAFKGANSRYLPGEVNPDWATADIPRR